MTDEAVANIAELADYLTALKEIIDGDASTDVTTPGGTVVPSLLKRLTEIVGSDLASVSGNFTVPSGSLGVGTSSPAQKVHIQDGNIQIETTSNSRQVSIELESVAGNLWMGTATTAGKVVLETGHTGDNVASSGTAHAVIDGGNSGTLLLNSGVTLGNGLVYAASNTLDDYEEGTFTPVLEDPSTNEPTFVYQNGDYTKIGNRVFCEVRVSVSALASASGAIRLKGLPFTQNSAKFGDCHAHYGGGLAITAGASVGGYVEANTTRAWLQLWDATTGISDMTFAHLSADGDLMITLNYFI